MLCNSIRSLVLIKSSRFNSEVKPFLAILLVAFSFSFLAIRDTLQQRMMEENLTLPQIVTGINSKDILAGRHDFFGKPEAPYILVEFGDYECPPCRGTQKVLAALIAKYSNQIKLDFRQFPLTQLHPNAMEYALTAESARQAGKFWQVHQELYSAEFNEPKRTNDIYAITGIQKNIKKATEQIRQDADLALRLSVKGTPTFFLCSPNGTVNRLVGLQGLDKIVMK